MSFARFRFYLCRVQIFFYNLFLLCYQFFLMIASAFHEKAGKWQKGRKDIFQKLESALPHNEKRIWVHCASLGEFEQGRPFIEAFKKKYPSHKIVLSFFSPSGYELRKDYEHADYVFYLPLDGKRNASRFVALIAPSLVVFVKYEFWYYYISEVNRKNIPLLLISGAFRKEQPFFKWYGGMFRKMLRKFTWLFVQDQRSADLLTDIGITESVLVTGDTRYDRVYEISLQAKSFPLIEKWKVDASLLIAGSTWAEDERVLKTALSALPGDWKLIIAPHEIQASRIRQVKDLFPDSVLYSELDDAADMQKRVLIIDNMGMLSSIYRYGKIAFIGGGFNKGGIHNTLEPAVFGLPVIFGPVFQKFVEATELYRRGFAFPVQNADECIDMLKQFTEHPSVLAEKQKDIRQFVQQNIGATDKILNRLHNLTL